MKLKICSLIIFSAFFTTLNAQDHNFRFGLKAEPALSWFKTDSKNLKSDGSKLTFSWGFMGEYFFAENYAFAFGVELASRGGIISWNDSGIVSEIDMRLKYIDIPIAIKMRTNEIGYMRYFGQFGFTPGFNISAKSDFEVVDFNGNKVSLTDEDIKSDVVPINVALNIALGLEYGLSGNTALLISLNFNNGFVDIIKKDFNDNPEADFKVLSNYAGVTVGVLF